MGFLVDLAPGLPAIHHIHQIGRVPGAVRRLSARDEPWGDLVLRWQPPAGGTWVDGYRIGRTAQGRDYEWLGETEGLEFTVADPPRGEPWFYTVRAFNARGAGAHRTVWLYRRPARLRPRGPVVERVLLPVQAVPGLRVNIFE